jgi:hypothetical protein
MLSGRATRITIRHATIIDVTIRALSVYTYHIGFVPR